MKARTSDVRKAITDAYYSARNNGRTMETAADWAAIAVMDLLRAEKAEELTIIPDKNLYYPSKGEEVDVNLRGRVVQTYAEGERFQLAITDHDRSARSMYIDTNQPVVISVEKVEPPVVTFTAPQRVRSKASDREYTIGLNGYFDHHRRIAVLPSTPHPFTSKDYELVEE